MFETENPFADDESLLSTDGMFVKRRVKFDQMIRNCESIFKIQSKIKYNLVKESLVLWSKEDLLGNEGKSEGYMEDSDEDEEQAKKELTLRDLQMRFEAIDFVQSVCKTVDNVFEWKVNKEDYSIEMVSLEFKDCPESIFCRVHALKSQLEQYEQFSEANLLEKLSHVQGGVVNFSLDMLIIQLENADFEGIKASLFLILEDIYSIYFYVGIFSFILFLTFLEKPMNVEKKSKFAVDKKQDIFKIMRESDLTSMYRFFNHIKQLYEAGGEDENLSNFKENYQIFSCDFLKFSEFVYHHHEDIYHVKNISDVYVGKTEFIKKFSHLTWILLKNDTAYHLLDDSGCAMIEVKGHFTEYFKQIVQTTDIHQFKVADHPIFRFMEMASTALKGDLEFKEKVDQALISILETLIRELGSDLCWKNSKVADVSLRLRWVTLFCYHVKISESQDYRRILRSVDELNNLEIKRVDPKQGRYGHDRRKFRY